MTPGEIPRVHIDDAACPEHFIRVLAVEDPAELESLGVRLYRENRWVLIDLDHSFCLAVACSAVVDARAAGLDDR